MKVAPALTRTGPELSVLMLITEGLKRPEAPTNELMMQTFINRTIGEVEYGKEGHKNL